MLSCPIPAGGVTRFSCVVASGSAVNVGTTPAVADPHRSRWCGGKARRQPMPPGWDGGPVVVPVLPHGRVGTGAGYQRRTHRRGRRDRSAVCRLRRRETAVALTSATQGRVVRSPANAGENNSEDVGQNRASRDPDDRRPGRAGRAEVCARADLRGGLPAMFPWFPSEASGSRTRSPRSITSPGRLGTTSGCSRPMLRLVPVAAVLTGHLPSGGFQGGRGGSSPG